MDRDLNGFIVAEQADVCRRWAESAVSRMPLATPDQRQAALEITRRFFPAYVDLLGRGSREALDAAVSWLAPSGMLRLLSLSQVQEVAGGLPQALWPLIGQAAGGDCAWLLAAAQALSESSLTVTRAVAEECHRRTRAEANESLECGITRAEVSRSVASSLDLDEVLRIVCAEGAQVLEMDAASVLLLDGDGALADTGHGDFGGDTSAVALSADHRALCERAIATGRAQTASLRPAATGPAGVSPAGEGWLAVPLSAKGQTLGAMLFTDREHPGRLETPRGAELLVTAELLVAQVGLSLYNARLHSEVRQLARALDQSHQEEAAHRALLQAKNRELEAFVHTVSHDLRSPLVSLHGLMGLLRAELGDTLSDASRHLMDRLAANVVRMERLISDLLRLSRVGKQARGSDVPLAPLVEEMLEDWRPRLDARGIAVSVSGHLPVVRADATYLRQALENLLGNAAKFSGDVPEPRITIACQPAGSAAHVSVRDNGIGIAPEYHERVFEIFQRVHDLPGVDGTGVGLAIVKKAVESWSGQVWIESAEGQGCTVHFTVPAAVVPGATSGEQPTIRTRESEDQR